MEFKKNWKLFLTVSTLLTVLQALYFEINRITSNLFLIQYKEELKTEGKSQEFIDTLGPYFEHDPFNILYLLQFLMPFIISSAILYLLLTKKDKSLMALLISSLLSIVSYYLVYQIYSMEYIFLWANISHLIGVILLILALFLSFKENNIVWISTLFIGFVFLEYVETSDLGFAYPMFAISNLVDLIVTVISIIIIVLCKKRMLTQ